MASKIDIANVALTILGKPTISNLSDGSNASNAINGVYDPIRRRLLTGRSVWRFSIVRTKLPTATGTPASGPFTQSYPLPGDCLRVLLAGDTYPSLDLSDYRMGPTDAGYSVEGRSILCDYGAPLSLKYVGDIIDTTFFDPCFAGAFSAEIAWHTCERLTNSDAKQGAAKARKDEELANARATNAFENVPEYPADDTWILSRLQ